MKIYIYEPLESGCAQELAGMIKALGHKIVTEALEADITFALLTPHTKEMAFKTILETWSNSRSMKIAFVETYSNPFIADSMRLPFDLTRIQSTLQSLSSP